MDSDAWAVALSEPHELMYMCKQYSKNKAHFRKHRRLGKAKVNESLSSCNSLVVWQPQCACLWLHGWQSFCECSNTRRFGVCTIQCTQPFIDTYNYTWSLVVQSTQWSCLGALHTIPGCDIVCAIMHALVLCLTLHNYLCNQDKL